ncbi:MAG TPA: GEGP motif-containing diheme protein [Dissulfurispiraceae bacterium]|nr:GEGP motif-containing diheme protein [Dissulfurispiraceae bacterium]
MRKYNKLVAVVFFVVLAAVASVATAAYQHAGDADNDARVFLNVYPGAAGTKLDNCALCHGGGVYTSGGKSTTMGSCQYCHAITNYGKQADQFVSTLNSFGSDYLTHGRNEAALKAIESLDSDGDGYSNLAEITAIRYPGDKNDDPTKVAAPFRIFDKAQLEAMPQHSQFMLMNTTKSGDYYAEYSGVVMEDLLKAAGIRADAVKITVYAPDGYSVSHPLADDLSNTGTTYSPYVNGIYPQAVYYYDTVADKANGGWCDYTSPGNAGRNNGDLIHVYGGLRMILALRADGKDLVPGYLDSTNKLASGTEGPFRTITPQKLVGPPDQPSNKSNPSLIWPYNSASDHNAGFSSKSATIIKIDPLPEGTTDIDVLEAGWNYVDSGKIVVYGDIDPRLNILDKLSAMISVIKAADADAFKHPGFKRELIEEIHEAYNLIAKTHYSHGLHELEREILPRLDNCSQARRHDNRDWVTDCDLQQRLLWSLQEVITLLKIVI